MNNGLVMTGVLSENIILNFGKLFKKYERFEEKKMERKSGTAIPESLVLYEVVTSPLEHLFKKAN